MTVKTQKYGRFISKPLVIEDTQIKEYHDYKKIQAQIYLFSKKNDAQNIGVIFPEITPENEGHLTQLVVFAYEAFKDAGKKGVVTDVHGEEIHFPKLNWKDFFHNVEKRKRYHKIDFTKVKMPQSEEENQAFQNTMRSYFQALREESKRDLTIVFPKLSDEEHRKIIPFLTRTARDYGIYLGYRQKDYDVPEKKFTWQEFLRRDMTSMDKIELDFTQMQMPREEQKEDFVTALKNFLIQHEDKRIKYKFSEENEALTELVKEAGAELKGRKVPKNHFLAQKRVSERY